MNDYAREQHKTRQNPIPHPGNILGEMIGRRKTDLWKQHQCRGHAEVGWVENMLRAALAHGGSNQDLGADRKDDREYDGP